MANFDDFPSKVAWNVDRKTPKRIVFGLESAILCLFVFMGFAVPLQRHPRETVFSL